MTTEWIRGVPERARGCVDRHGRQPDRICSGWGGAYKWPAGSCRWL